MRNITFLLFMLIAGMMNAQIPVWINSFETEADMQGWTFYDLNNNGNKWVQGKNIYQNGTSLAYGTSGVLRYSISLVPKGMVRNFTTEHDWVISPEIDLSNAGGTITLAAYIGRQRTMFTSLGRNLWIYVSTPQKPIPTIADFRAMSVDATGKPISSSYKISAGDGAAPFPPDLTKFVESKVDLSAFAGKKIYIGMRSIRHNINEDVQNINIDEMGIYASTLSTTEATKNKSLTKVKQNPVVSTLQLQLNPAMAEGKTKVQIFNAAGQEMLNTKYGREVAVSQLAPGIYIVLVTDGVLTEKVKFIKK